MREWIDVMTDQVCPEHREKAAGGTQSAQAAGVDLGQSTWVIAGQKPSAAAAKSFAPVGRTVPQGSLREARDTPVNRRALLLVTVLHGMKDWKRSARAADEICRRSAAIAAEFGLDRGLYAKQFQREQLLGKIYSRLRFGPDPDSGRIAHGLGGLTPVEHARRTTAAERLVEQKEAEIARVVEECQALRIANAVEAVRLSREQIGTRLPPEPVGIIPAPLHPAAPASRP